MKGEHDVRQISAPVISGTGMKGTKVSVKVTARAGTATKTVKLEVGKVR